MNISPEELIELFSRRWAIKIPHIENQIVVKRHKKHLFLQSCAICGKKFRGNQGVAVHTVKMHKNHAMDNV